MDYSQFLLMKEELSLIAVIVILFIADLFMSPDAHKHDGKPMLNTMLPVALLIVHTLITIVPGPAADAFGGMYHNQPIPIEFTLVDTFDILRALEECSSIIWIIRQLRSTEIHTIHRLIQHFFRFLPTTEV